MVIDLLFILCIFIIYSHNITKLKYYEIVIRIVIFSIGLKYFYYKEAFFNKPPCYPQSSESSIYDAYESVSKGWCTNEKIENNDSSSRSNNSIGGSNSEHKVNLCNLGYEAHPEDSASSNSKSLCLDTKN